MDVRLKRRIRISEAGCWEWLGRTRADGYGSISITFGIGHASRKHMPVYRIAYVTWVGPLTDGLTIDHLCRNRRCINPGHLEEVTQAENTRRIPGSLFEIGKPVCDNGHQFTVANTYLRPNGHRDCRACIRDRVRRYKARRAAA